MLVSVIMSAYNEPNSWVSQAVESIINQTYKNLEIIIVIDNPDNLELLNLVKTYELTDKRIKIVRNSENIGLVNSLNKAIDLTSGDYIARMDADDIAVLDRIEKQLKYLLENDLDILGGGRTIIDEEGNIIENFITHINGANNVKKALAEKDIVYHPTWLLRKDVYVKLGKYRTIHAAEDYDFLLRALLKGYIIDNINEEVLLYRDRATSISNLNSLKQVLTSYHLQKNFRNNKQLELEDLNKYLKKINLDKNLEKFQVGMEYLRLSLENYKNKKLINLMINMVKASTSSKYVRLYIYMRIRYSFVRKYKLV